MRMTVATPLLVFCACADGFTLTGVAATPLRRSAMPACQLLPPDLMPPDDDGDPPKKPGYPKRVPLEPWTYPWFVDQALTFMSYGFFIVLVPPLLLGGRLQLGGTLASKDADFANLPSARKMRRDEASLASERTEATLYGRGGRQADIFGGDVR